MLLVLLTAFFFTACVNKNNQSQKQEQAPTTASAPPVAQTTTSKNSNKNELLLQENFEEASKPAYAANTIETPSGKWRFDDAMIGTLDDDHKSGTRAIRLRNNGKVAMTFDVTVKGTVTIAMQHAKYGNDGPSSWELWVSINQGASFTQIGKTIKTTNKQLQPASFTANTNKTIRFEIRKVGSDNHRLNIDNIRISLGGGTITPTEPSKPVTDNTNTTASNDDDDDDHLLLGNPSNASTSLTMPDNYLMDKGFYKLSYSSTNSTPNWVSWHISKRDFGKSPRVNDFRPDESLPHDWYRVTHSSYSSSGFDRGHNCPSADRTSSKDANESTFLMTNMIPQAPNHNQHLWSGLEEYTRELVKQGNEVYVLMGSYGTGGVGNRGKIMKIDKKNVNVPANIWKIIVVIPEGKNDLQRIDKNTRVIAVNTPNSNDVNFDWQTYLTSVESIEKATKYKLLSNVPENVRKELIKKVDKGK
ncbi:endonuclease G [Chitinophaga skermanii]|uniref:Endonuclease G n=2 Tax=Chitinophaga skermanii TaxID=331697 RepID=A0A327R3S7_9BACT|nr:endonuclease G [Chitinophaga skermanii]